MSRARSGTPPPERKVSYESADDDIELQELGQLSDSSSDSDIIYRNGPAEMTPGDLDDGADASSIPPRRKRARRASFTLYTPDEERAVIRKLDRKLVLFMALLYMLSFLDRSNIGNARIAGLDRDLGLVSWEYESLLSAFYVTYILFEWMTILFSVLKPHRFISIVVASWGLIASLQSLVTGFEVLLLLRAALGIAEAAYAGVPFYLSFFFRREELAFRTGLFISAAPLATSFASTLAWAITYLARKTPFAPWRLLFLIEGFPSLFVAVIAWFHIPDSPETAHFLTARQRQVAGLRLRDERKRNQAARGTGKKGLAWKQIGKTLIDPKSYLTALMLFGSNVAFASLPPFLPTIIEEMGFSELASQALSAPPYLVSFGLVLLTAYSSDRHRARSPFVIAAAITSATGYALLAISGAFRWSEWFRYFAVYPAAAGFFCAITIIIAWTMNNQASAEGKGTGMAMLNIIGQMGPLIGTRLYPDSDKPYYVSGMTVCAGSMLFVALLAAILRWVLRRANLRTAMEVNYVPLGEGVDAEDPLEEGKGEDRAKKRQFVYML